MYKYDNDVVGVWGHSSFEIHESVEIPHTRETNSYDFLIYDNDVWQMRTHILHICEDLVDT